MASSPDAAALDSMLLPLSMAGLLSFDGSTVLGIGKRSLDELMIVKFAPMGSRLL
jgi:hypothetical protein